MAFLKNTISYKMKFDTLTEAEVKEVEGRFVEQMKDNFLSILNQDIILDLEIKVEYLEG